MNMILMKTKDKAHWVCSDLFSYRFTGSDIVSVVRDALMEPIRTVQKATHYMKVSFFFENIGASIKTLTFNQYSSYTFIDEN